MIAVTVACTLSARFFPFVRLVENWVYDLRVATLLPPMPQSQDIVVVAVTEDTLAMLPYRSPVDREFLSNLLRALEQKGAKHMSV